MPIPIPFEVSKRALLKSSALTGWKKLLKKGHHGVISQFNVIQVTEQASQVVPPSLQLILDQYPKVFEIITTLPPSRSEHDHNIPLLLRSQPPNV